MFKMWIVKLLVEEKLLHLDFVEVTCGKGSIERTRECENDPDLCYGEALEQPSCQCEGVDGETQDCNAGECFTWASWQPWGVCSQVLYVNQIITSIFIKT